MTGTVRCCVRFSQPPGRATSARIRYLAGRRRKRSCVSQRFRPGDRLRGGAVRHVQGGAHPLHPGLAYQLAPEGIRANRVSPGNTYFPGGVWENIEQHNPELFAHAMGLNPTGRMARPEEIARAAVFVASQAVSFVSGTNLVIDGA